MRDAPLPELRRLCVEGYDNERAPFYRKVYAECGFCPAPGWPHSVAEWQATPCITKDDLARFPLAERMFRPREEFLCLATSSGTTGKAAVLGARSRYHAWGGGLAGAADRVMYFRMASAYLCAPQNGMATIAGDLSDIPATVKIAAAFGVDAFETSVSQLMLLTEPLSKAMDLKKVKLLILIAERFSQAGYEFMRTHYPNALILPTYGGAETHGVWARACLELGRTPRDLVHFSEADVYPELINPETGAPVTELEAEGEIVLTMLWEKNMFPVIRFRTGDLARRVAPPCGCGRETFEILGRVDFDRHTIPGGLLKSEEIERAMAPYHGKITDDFELHIFDVPGTPARLKFELKVRPTAELDLPALAKDIARRLMVGPAQTLEAVLAAAGYELLSARVFTSDEPPRAKLRRIVRHA